MADLKVNGELDAEIARRVFGHVLPDDWQNRLAVPPYSTKIAHAWTVVEHFRAQGWLVTVKDMPPGFPFVLGDIDDSRRLNRRSVCDMQWMPLSTAADCRRSIYRHPMGVGDTPSEAICRAALEAVEAEHSVQSQES